MSALDPRFLDHALRVARDAADAAAREIDRYWQRDIDVRRKDDDSPVTEADEAAERAIRAVLRAAFPDHAIDGEEQGVEGAGPFRWLVDPIDGTKSFVRRTPMFSTQIALMHGDALVLGVSKAPVFGETAWARVGGGAFLDGERIVCSAAATVAGASLSFGNLKSLASGPRWAELAALVREADRCRGYGDFYHYHLLARGALDLVIESDLNILDIAALTVIAREAGATVTDLDGAAIGLGTRSMLAAPPALHATVLGRFGGWR